MRNYAIIRDLFRVSLAHLSGDLLLCKGASQGKTPKEWSIKYDHVPLVKQALVARSVVGIDGLNTVAAFIDRGAEQQIEITDAIVSQRVLSICRDGRG